jgi:hypothetical protein
MKIAYSRTALPKTIFLAGPTPRSKDVQSWRPQAVQILKDLAFDGTVYVPEDSDGSARFSYDDQIEWELQALHSSTVIAFWIPRELNTMPALTTNIEFGLFARNRNIVLGAPPDAVKMKYLEGLATLYNINGPHQTLESTMTAAIVLANRPFKTS